MAKIERVISPLPQTEEEVTPLKLLFYCTHCEKVIAAKQTRKRFAFLCPVCGKTDVAYGTAPSVQNFYHIAEDALTPIDGPFTVPVAPAFPPRGRMPRGQTPRSPGGRPSPRGSRPAAPHGRGGHPPRPGNLPPRPATPAAPIQTPPKPAN